MQDFESAKIGIYVSIYNALPDKEKYHIHGDKIVGDNKSITITPNEEPGMVGRVNVILECDLTDLVITDTHMIYTITAEANQIVQNLFCKYTDKLEKNSQNILIHLRSMFDSVYTRDSGVYRDEWYVNSNSQVTIKMSDDMTHITFEIIRKDERSITTTQQIYLPLYRVTPDTVVNNVIPTIQSLVSI